MDKPLVSVVISTHNRREKLVRLIRSILESNYPKDRLEIIVIDDASTDGTYEHIRSTFPNIKALRSDKELFPSMARNLGARISNGKYIFFLDDDNIIDKNTIGKLVDFLDKHPDYGLVGPLMFYLEQPNVIWCTGAIIDKPLYRLIHLCQGKRAEECHIIKRKVIECDYIPNAYMIRKHIFEKIGGFDHVRFPIAWEEIDLAIRVKKLGYRVGIVTTAKVWHDVPLTKDFHITPIRAYYRGRSRILFYLKYVKGRVLLLPIDIAGFLLILGEQHSHNTLYNSISSLLISYIKGMIDGIKTYTKYLAKKSNNAHNIRDRWSIIIRGLFGGLNSGDDSALESFLQLLSLISERKNVKVDIYIYFPGRGKVIEDFLRVYGTKKNINIIPINGRLQLIYYLVRKTPDIYVICGGQKHGVLALLDSLLILFAKIINPRIKILYVGVGYSHNVITRILKDRKITHQHYLSKGVSVRLKLALILLSLLRAKVYVRDKLTYLLLRYLGFQRIKLIRDLVFYLRAFHLSNYKQLSIENFEPYIVITPRNLLYDDLNNKQVAVLLEILKQCIKEYPHAKILLLITSLEDLEIVISLLNSIKGIKLSIPIVVLFAYKYLPSSIIYALSTIRIIKAISLRLHAALFLYKAHCNNITLVGYDYKALEYSKLRGINLVTIKNFEELLSIFYGGKP